MSAPAARAVTRTAAASVKAEAKTNAMAQIASYASEGGSGTKARSKKKSGGMDVLGTAVFAVSLVFRAVRYYILWHFIDAALTLLHFAVDPRTWIDPRKWVALPKVIFRAVLHFVYLKALNVVEVLVMKQSIVSALKTLSPIPPVIFLADIGLHLPTDLYVGCAMAAFLLLKRLKPDQVASWHQTVKDAVPFDVQSLRSRWSGEGGDKDQ